MCCNFSPACPVTVPAVLRTYVPTAVSVLSAGFSSKVTAAMYCTLVSLMLVTYTHC